MTPLTDLIGDITSVDAHCHVDLFDSPHRIIAKADSACIATIAVTNAPSVFPHTERLTTISRYVYPAIGLHPELVHSHGRELQLFEQMLPRTRFVGEIGLDYCSGDRSFHQMQRSVFEQIIRLCVEQGDKVLTIHSRRAVADVLSIVGADFLGTAILHWFSGTVKQLASAAAAGFWFSVNPAMISSVNGRRLISEMPQDRVLTETDGPFVSVSSRPADPTDTFVVLRHLADTWGVSEGDAAHSVVRNFMRATQVREQASKTVPAGCPPLAQ